LLMQYLEPERRKGEHKYKHGDFILYDDRPSEEKQKQLMEDAVKKGYSLKKCAVCGRFMKEWDHHAYCSQRCINDAYMARRRRRHEQELKKQCVVCGVIFTAKRKDAQYCSAACKQAAYRRRNDTDNRCAEFCTTERSNIGE